MKLQECGKFLRVSLEHARYLLACFLPVTARCWNVQQVVFYLGQFLLRPISAEARST